MSHRSPSIPEPPQHYGATIEEQRLTSPYALHHDDDDDDSNAAAPVPRNNNNNDDNDDNTETSTSSSDSEYEMSLTELLYSSASYHAIVKPVTLTMTLAALSVMYINDADTIQQGEAEMAAAYQVFGNNDSDDDNGGSDQHSNLLQLEWSLANSFILVCGICAMTFVIVILYKFRFMKFLIAYMMFASTMLLGYLGGTMWQTGIEIYRWPVDQLTFYLCIYNFCVVGVYSIFDSQGVPTYVTQAYLVATSVILAWQLAHFDAWTSWTLLIMLALYDLCAVLTPCGPLKALVHLMSKEDSPDMPGLLYEAELPPEAQRPGVPQSMSRRSNTNTTTSNNGLVEPTGADNTSSTAAVAASSLQRNERDAILEERTVIPDHVPMTTSSMEAEQEQQQDEDESAMEDAPTVELPLALARVYNLPIVAFSHHHHHHDNTNSSALLLNDLPEHPTPQQLKTNVLVRLPLNGGRIERLEGGRKVFLERDRFGKPKRTVWMDRQGKVYAEQVREGDDEENDFGNRRANTIRLGLGDFIFYSVLVAKASQYSFATFAACMLVILAGLGGTLVLLSVYHHALPALPISIFLGVFFYLVTRGLVEPWVENVLRIPFYV